MWRRLFGTAKDSSADAALPAQQPKPVQATPAPVPAAANNAIDTVKILQMAARISKVGHWVWDPEGRPDAGDRRGAGEDPRDHPSITT